MPLQYERFQKKRVQQDTTKQRICYWQCRHEHHVTKREGRQKTNSGGAWKANFMGCNHSNQQEGQRQQQKIKTRKMFSSYLQWWWGKEMGVGRQWIWLFSLKVPIKSLQLTADNYFQLEETVLKLLKRFPAKRTNCVYLSHFQKGGKGDLGVRWGRTMETGASMHWGNSWASREWQAKRQGRWGGKESGGCWGSAPRGGGAAAQCIHAAGGGGVI